MLLHAVHAGVTFFDTADTYGDLAEELLGEVVRPYRHLVRLATKVGIRGGQKPDLSRKAVFQACEGSLRRLQTDCIDLYQVHFDDPSTPVAETVGALQDLARAGKIRKYGIGHLPLERIRAYLKTGQVFSGQFELSAVAREARAELLPLLQAHHTGLIAFSVTGRGLLAGGYPDQPVFEPGDIRAIDPLFQRERWASALRTAEKFAVLGRLVGKSSVQVAIAWVLAQPGVLCALTGPSTAAHLAENLGGSGWTIDQEHLAALETFFAGEDQRLRAEQVKTVQELLTSALPPDPAQAIQDLIYTIETAITAGWADQEEVMPLFLEVLQVRKNPGEDPLGSLEKLRQELGRLVQVLGME
jgi:aryl-alcohol dehydrogenase-like predicted oxidoreductase